MSAWKRHARRARTRVRVVSRDGASSVDAWISAAWRGGQGRRDKFPCHVSSDLKPRLRLRFPLGSRIVTWSPPLATIFRCCFGKRESSIPLSTRGAKKRGRATVLLSLSALSHPRLSTTTFFSSSPLPPRPLRLPLLFCDKPPSVKHHANTGRAIGAFSRRYRRRENSLRYTASETHRESPARNRVKYRTETVSRPCACISARCPPTRARTPCINAALPLVFVVREQPRAAVIARRGETTASSAARNGARYAKEGRRPRSS